MYHLISYFFVIIRDQVCDRIVDKLIELDICSKHSPNITENSRWLSYNTQYYGKLYLQKKSNIQSYETKLE